MLTFPDVRLPHGPIKDNLEAVRDYAHAEAEALWARVRFLEGRIAALENWQDEVGAREPEDEASAGATP